MRRIQHKTAHLAVLSLYSLLALVLTWPLVLQITTHVPGDGIDDPSLAWNLWWIKERLVDQLNPDFFHVGWIFFPVEINLGFYTLTPLNGFLSIPLQTAIDLVVASNVLLLSSYSLGGYGTFLLVRDLINRDRTTAGGHRDTRLALIAAATAGIVYAFASSKLFYASLGQFNIASNQWIPFTVLYVLRTGRSPGWREATLAGLFLVLQAWSELTYASFLLIFVGLYFLWRMAFGQDTVSSIGGQLNPKRLAEHHHKDRPETVTRVSLTGAFGFMGFVFLAGITPFLWAMIPDLVQEGDFFASGGGFANTFSADLMGYLLPTRLHPLFGEWTAGLSFPNIKGQHIYVGYAAMLLMIGGVVHVLGRGGWRGLFWPLCTLWFWWSTLGESARWAGNATTIPGPFVIISRLPFFSGNRYPSRYSVMLMLCVAVLVGLGILNLGNRLTGAGHSRVKPSIAFRRYSAIALVFVAVFLFEHLSVPMPLNDLRIPSIYQRIAREPGDFTLLELPTGWRNGARVLGKSDVLIMMQQWYQTEHGKRRLGGNTSRNPTHKFQYFTEAPLIGDLIALMNADAIAPDGTPYMAQAVDSQWNQLVQRNLETAPAVLDFLDVRFVTLHVEQSPPQLIRFVEEVLPVTLADEWVGTNWAGENTTIRLYEVTPPDPQVEQRVSLGSPTADLHLAEGWSAAGLENSLRFATRQRAALLLDLPEQEGQLTVKPLPQPPPEGAPVSFELNGRPLAVVEIQDNDQSLRVRVPAAAADQTIDRLTLNFQDSDFSSKELLARQSDWNLGTDVAAPPTIFVESAGNYVGDFARIFVNGQQVAQNLRGYNLVSVDENGQVLASAVFDTHGSAAASPAMAEWLGQWPDGTIIAGAVRDEASMNLTSAATDALQALGVTENIQGNFRASHAFVVRVHSGPGHVQETRETFSQLRPARSSLGIPLDSATVSGAVQEIHWQPACFPCVPPDASGRVANHREGVTR